MKPRLNFVLFVLSVFAIFVFASCATTGGPVEDNSDDEFDAVEANADEAFEESFGDGEDIEGGPIEDDIDDLTNDEKDPIKEDKIDKPEKIDPPVEENTVGLERYNKYWKNRKDPDYPSSRYLIGVGSKSYDLDNEKSSAIRQAAADARNEIAAFFKAQIQSKVQTEQEKLVTIKNEVRHVSMLIKNEYNLSQSVQQSVKGAEQKGIAYDTKQKIVYVLVVLDRKRAAEIINEQLKAIKSNIEGKISVFQTAYSEDRPLKATSLLAQAINMIVEFRQKRQEAIFIAPEGFDIVDLEGIEEGGLVQQLAEITVDLTFMIKSIVKTTDENGVTEVQKLNSVTSKISEKLRKSSNLIMLKAASSKLKGTSFEEVSGWGVEELKAAAPDVRIILLASLEAEITDTTEIAGRTAYIANTTFSVQMIDVTTGDIVHSVDSAEHNLYAKTKAMLNSSKASLNASIGNAAEVIAKEIFKFINPS